MQICKAHPLLVSTDGELLKGLNTVRLPSSAPIIANPRRATAALLFQAQKKINKGQNRKKILGQLQTSTARAPAAVTAPATAAGSGGGGYSGNAAYQIGSASNPGVATPTLPRPTPVT